MRGRLWEVVLDVVLGVFGWRWRCVLRTFFIGDGPGGPSHV